MGNETWHPLKPADAKNLTAMLAQFNTRSPSGQRRVHMTLYLWSRLWDERDGVPYFNCGGRTIAKACGVTHKAVREYIERMEQDGWIVRLEEPRRGGYVKRTFAWLAGDTVPLEGHTLCRNNLQKGHTNCAPGQGKKGTQNMEHVNSGVDTPPHADAASGVPAEKLINAATGEPFDTVLRDPDEIRKPEWMK